jgi:hypothetical protein
MNAMARTTGFLIALVVCMGLAALAALTKVLALAVGAGLAFGVTAIVFARELGSHDVVGHHDIVVGSMKARVVILRVVGAICLVGSLAAIPAVIS